MSRPVTKQTILERVTEMTRQGREREAEKILDLKVIRQLISNAALEGFNRITIAPDKAVDVSQTTAAKTAVEALQADGFSIEWEVRRQPDGRTSQSLIVQW